MLQEFEAWWKCGGERLVSRIAENPHQEACIKDLCRISYFQGRMDADTKTLEMYPPITIPKENELEFLEFVKHQLTG